MLTILRVSRTHGRWQTIWQWHCQQVAKMATSCVLVVGSSDSISCSSDLNRIGGSLAILTIVTARIAFTVLGSPFGNLFAILSRRLSLFSLKHISRRHLVRPCEKKANPAWRNEGPVPTLYSPPAEETQSCNPSYQGFTPVPVRGSHPSPGCTRYAPAGHCPRRYDLPCCAVSCGPYERTQGHQVDPWPWSGCK